MPQVKSPKMNDNIGEQVSCGSNLGSSQINEPVLSILIFFEMIVLVMVQWMIR